MSKAIRAGICVLCLGSLYAHATEASINFAFQRIADHNTAVPDKVTTFKGFGQPSLDNGKVAFIGVDTLREPATIILAGVSANSPRFAKTLTPAEVRTVTFFCR